MIEKKYTLGTRTRNEEKKFDTWHISPISSSAALMIMKYNGFENPEKVLKDFESGEIDYIMVNENTQISP